MGNQCCSDKIYDIQRIINQEYEINKTTAFKRKSNRNKKEFSQNDRYVAKMNKSHQIQKMLQYFKLNQRKFKRPVRIDLDKQQHNRQQQVYSLLDDRKLIKAFYIGEWVYDQDALENVPQGVGKMFQKNYISQGQIQTQVLKQDEYSVKLRTYLNGKGRKYNKIEIMQGEFIKGKLWGKGTYSKKQQNKQQEGDNKTSDQFNKISQDSYNYDGAWVNGKRHGRGIEETLYYKYAGDFVNDVRSGNGHFIFILNGQKRHKIMMQQQGLHDKIKELINQQKANKDKIAKKEQEKKKHQQQIKNILQKYPWQNPFSKQSLFEHPDFKRQRKIRTCYEQSYTGQFQDNKFQGQGTYTWYNGKIFTGNWAQGEMDGIGQFSWPDGTIYRGQYKHDKRHGKGEMIWCDVRKWRGSWAYGLRHGYGQTICIDDEYKYMTIQGSLWNKDKQYKVYFTKTHNLRDGLVRQQAQQNLLNGQQIPEQSFEPVDFQNNQAFIITSLVDRSFTQSLKQRSQTRQKHYGTQATWMKLNIFDST